MGFEGDENSKFFPLVLLIKKRFSVVDCGCFRLRALGVTDYPSIVKEENFLRITLKLDYSAYRWIRNVGVRLGCFMGCMAWEKMGVVGAEGAFAGRRPGAGSIGLKAAFAGRLDIRLNRVTSGLSNIGISLWTFNTSKVFFRTFTTSKLLFGPSHLQTILTGLQEMLTCSNCKHLVGKISILKATLDTAMSSGTNHTVNSRDTSHDDVCLNEMEENLDVCVSRLCRVEDRPDAIMDLG
ncbi:hypothetical protein Tco_0586007 [Tanacetum coccineum]